MGFAVEVVTLMPDLWPTLVSRASGLVGRAFEDGKATLTVGHLKDFGFGKHSQVDDTPFGGGAGMVLAVEPLHRAIERARGRTPGPVVLLTPRGRTFEQATARRLAAGPGLTLVCGRYEGFDERVRNYVDEEISLGDFVLSGGDPAAFAIIDTLVRLLPGVLGNPDSIEHESFEGARLEHPHYTRPITYDGESVPEVLRCGDHGRIHAWRRAQSDALTGRLRPDLLERDEEE